LLSSQTTRDAQSRKGRMLAATEGGRRPTEVAANIRESFPCQISLGALPPGIAWRHSIDSSSARSATAGSGNSNLLPRTYRPQATVELVASEILPSSYVCGPSKLGSALRKACA